MVVAELGLREMVSWMLPLFCLLLFVLQVQLEKKPKQTHPNNPVWLRGLT